MNEIIGNEELETPQKRPVFLTVLCVLSFVYIGLSLISGLFSLLTGPASEDAITTMKVLMTTQANEMTDLGVSWAANLMKNMVHIVESTNTQHYLVVLSGILISVIGAIGVFWMLKGKKLGFHFYIIYCLMSVVQLYFFVDAKYIPTFLVVFNIVFSGLWILLYSRNLKWLK